MHDPRFHKEYTEAWVITFVAHRTALHQRNINLSLSYFYIDACYKYKMGIFTLAPILKSQRIISENLQPQHFAILKKEAFEVFRLSNTSGNANDLTIPK